MAVLLFRSLSAFPSLGNILKESCLREWIEVDVIELHPGNRGHSLNHCRGTNQLHLLCRLGLVFLAIILHKLGEVGLVAVEIEAAGHLRLKQKHDCKEKLGTFFFDDFLEVGKGKLLFGCKDSVAKSANFLLVADAVNKDT